MSEAKRAELTPYERALSYIKGMQARGHSPFCEDRQVPLAPAPVPFVLENVAQATVADRAVTLANWYSLHRRLCVLSLTTSASS